MTLVTINVVICPDDANNNNLHAIGILMRILLTYLNRKRSNYGPEVVLWLCFAKSKIILSQKVVKWFLFYRQHSFRLFA